MRYYQLRDFAAQQLYPAHVKRYVEKGDFECNEAVATIDSYRMLIFIPTSHWGMA